VTASEILSPPQDYDQFLDKIKNSVNQSRAAPHQLRNIHGGILKVKNVQELKRLRYKLAYTGGRIREAKDLCNLLEDAIRRADREEHLARIREFLEAVIAYQKSFGK
jgi:CRISPR type III-A-associated protein Csm2